MPDGLPMRRLARRVSAAACGWMLLLLLAAGAEPVQASVSFVPVSAALVPAHGALWGAWPGPSDSALASFESTIGRRLDIVHQYHAFDSNWPTSTEYSWAAGGRIIFGNISARYSGGVYTWHSIAAGSEDSIIKSLAGRIRAFGRRIFVSFDQEPESRLGGAGFAATDYINASRRIHGLFAGAGATNAVWVWNVAGSTSSYDLARYKSLYPGDPYVDWVAWDPYNWNTCIHPYGWRTFDGIVAPFYNWLAAGHLSAGSAGKPYMLAEYGSVEGAAGAKSKWFKGEASTLSSRPRLKAVVYFNENKDCNWPITTSSSSVSGFAYVGRTCWVNRTLPVAPASVSGAAGNGAVTVRWAAAKSVCPITRYTINTSPGGKTISVSGGALAATVTGLANGTAYTFAVLATSVNGSSGYSGRSAPAMPVGGVQTTPGGSPTAHPTGQTPGGSEPAAQVVRGTDSLTAWLESHPIAIPAALVAILGLAFGAQFVASRRRRRRS